MDKAEERKDKESAGLRLPADQITEALAACDGWQLVDGACHCRLTFPDFVCAFSFMAGAALISEQLGHHPEWSNTYNRVSIRLVTHDAGGVTEKDIAWIRAVLPLQRGATVGF